MHSSIKADRIALHYTTLHHWYCDSQREMEGELLSGSQKLAACHHKIFALTEDLALGVSILRQLKKYYPTIITGSSQTHIMFFASGTYDAWHSMNTVRPEEIIPSASTPSASICHHYRF
jgi:hypothetical protein